MAQIVYPHIEPGMKHINSMPSPQLASAILEQLEPRRIERMREVVAQRTRQLTVLLEVIDKGHNQSAILRTCEAYGVLDVHIVESPHKKFKPQRKISGGAHKWLNLHSYKHTVDAIHNLQEQGYKVLASNLSDDAKPLHTLDLTQRTALLFGTELNGVAPEAVEACDGSFIIPMVGFVQSFNVSVAAAMSLHEAYRQRLERFGQMGDLPADEQETLFQLYLTQAIPRRILHELQRRQTCPSSQK